MTSARSGSFKAKLYLAFAAIALLTLFATAFTLYLFNEYGKVVSTTSNQAIPQMHNVLQLSERAALLAAMAPVLAASQEEATLRETETRLDALADEIDLRVGQLTSPAYGAIYQAIQQDSNALVATHEMLKNVALARLVLKRKKMAVLADIRAVQGELLDILSPIVYGTTSLTNLFAKRSGRHNAGAIMQLGEVDANVLIILLDTQVAANRIAGLLQGAGSQAGHSRYQENQHREEQQKECETALTEIRTNLGALKAVNNTPALQHVTDLVGDPADSDPCGVISSSNPVSDHNGTTFPIPDFLNALESVVASQKAQLRSLFEQTARQAKSTPVAIADYAVREFQYALDIKAEGNLLVALLTAAADADDKHTVSNFFNRYTRSLGIFQNAIKVFAGSALAQRNPVLAASLLDIEGRLEALGEGESSPFSLRLSEFKVSEHIQSLLANHREQATSLTSHAGELVNAVRQEVADLQSMMAHSQRTGVSILVIIWLGNSLIAGLIAYLTTQVLSRHEFDLRTAKTAAEAANKELEAFNYSVSHDLRAPLRTLKGFSQALLEDYSGKLNETGVRYLRFLQEGSREMGDLIDGLLTLSRCTRGELVREPVDITALAEEIVRRHQASEPARHVTCRIAPAVEAEGDPRLLKTVLENLLGNAWKYTSRTADPCIELNSEQDAGETVYFVRDNGVGFDMAAAGRLFLPFQRLHRAGEFEGSGIGLATVQRIIHRHGGRIWAQAAVNKGATFKFTLAAGIR